MMLKDTLLSLLGVALELVVNFDVWQVQNGRHYRVVTFDRSSSAAIHVAHIMGGKAGKED